jgi:xylulokinase
MNIPAVRHQPWSCSFRRVDSLSRHTTREVLLSFFLGIDLGTSSVKSVLVDENEQIVGTRSVPLEVRRPAPGFAEQDPNDWWEATLASLDSIAASCPDQMAAVTGIGLSGQMHGATLLDASGDVLRPCILWNDTRSAAECEEFELAFPRSREITGNLAMPGFTAPKLLWMRRHEPDVFARVATILLPKAYLRSRLTGELVDEMSDASGTLWLDVGRREWSVEALHASGLTTGHMPRLVEGTAPTGTLRSELSRRWGMKPPVVAGGAGDNAAGAIGLGAVRPGSAFVSLGTSGVVFATTPRFAANPSAAVHTFCHALPATWHQMGVTLSAASCLSWWSGVTGMSEASLLAEIADSSVDPSPVLFLPYLSGERTPHNDAAIRGAFVGLSHETDRPALTRAVLEGVAFSLRDSLDALSAAGTNIESADVIGGGSRSRVWTAILASALDRPLHRLREGDTGAAFGAARLGRIASTGEAPETVCRPPRRLETIEPNPVLRDEYAERIEFYRRLYGATRPGRSSDQRR